MSPFLALIFIVPGTIIFFLGRYIGKTGYVDVLKHYNEKKVYDKVKLTQYVSRLMFYTSLLTVIFSLLAFILGLFIKTVDVVSIYLVIYFLITAHYMLKLRLCCKKFEIKE